MTARSHQSPPDARRPGGTDEQQRGRSADIVEEASRESLPASDPPAGTTVAGERDADVVARLQSEMAELKDRLLRALAEQENVRRRAAREREEAVRYAAGDLAADLLPTVDNLARAVVSLPAERTVRDETVRGVLTGLTAIERGLLGALARHGVVRISPTPGETFDPHRHQAMFEVETTAFPEGTVAEVLQPGYAHHDRLLRPAMVGVAKAPAGAARAGAGNDTVIGRTKVREVTAVFRSRESLDAAVAALLTAGFDRADIDLMASIDTVRQKLGSLYVPVEEAADVPKTPRHAFVADEALAGPLAQAVGILTFIGATAAAIGVAASGGAVAMAALGGGLATGGLAAVIARALGLKRARELEAQLESGGLVLWVRVRTPEHEARAQEVLTDSGGEAVHVHEIEIEKRLEDLPLSSLIAKEPT